LRGRVVEKIRVDGLDDGDVVDDFREVGEPVGELSAAFSVSGELEARAEDRRVTPDEGVALSLDDRGRQGLAL